MAADDATTDAVPIYASPKKKRGPPSLLDLTTQIAATNIEKYPAGLWGVLSESQWDAILRARVAQKTVPLRHPSAISSPPKKQQRQQHDNNNNSSTSLSILPALSAKHLSQIEQHPRNTHLAHSTTADELLWKAILNYKFRESGMNRPTSLSVPCGLVERTLEECAAVLLKVCAEVPQSDVLGYAEFVARKRAQLIVNTTDCQREQTASSNIDRLFNNDSEESDLDDEQQEADITEKTTNNNISEEFLQREYQQYMKQLANRNFEALKRTCYTLAESPMDVRLLADTKIGKAVSKSVKTLTKLKRTREDDTEDRIEIREIFWKRVVRWNGPIICYTSTTQGGSVGVVLGGDDDGQTIQQQQQQRGDRRREAVVELTPLELLQKLLDDWKEMASDSGVEIRSESAAAAASTNAALSPPKKKKRRTETTNPNDDHNKSTNNIRVTSCGRDKHITLDQHLIDMNLLHNSPDWRSLYVSLTNRELELRKSHGERVRATREHLERDRPKIGKVILKRAVGRVRGGDVGLGGGSVGSLLQINNVGSHGGVETSLSTSQISTNNNMMVGGGGATTTLATLNAERKIARQEAILNKSKGLRAIQKQRGISGAGSITSPPSTKVAQIRQTSKVAAKWSKSSFGNSVASAAGSKSGVRKVGMRKEEAQVQLSLQNGKTMKLPQSAAGKSTGKFSSLQQKMAAKSRGMKKRKH